MYGIFMESWVIFKNYGGNSLWLILYAAALIRLLICEKDRRVRIVFGYVPLTILLMFFFPVFRILYVAVLDDSDTYYRLLWLIPMGVTIAYSAALTIEKHKYIGAGIAVVIMILCGGYAYKGAFVSPAENAYHLPDTVVKICDEIAPEEGERIIYALFPRELVYYVRQYDTNIYLVYGRDSVEPTWGYYNELYEAMEGDEVIDMDHLLELTRGNDGLLASYIILGTDRDTSVDPADCGLELVDTVDNYRIYFDPVADEIMEGLLGVYQNK